MVFGVFDGFHKGHQVFLEQARALGDKLIIVVTQDTTVRELKNKWPQEPLDVRMQALRESGLGDIIIAGDIVRYSWSALRAYSPDIIALGYDQASLKTALEEYRQGGGEIGTITVLEAYEPHIYKSSLLYADTPAELQEKFAERQTEKQGRVDRGEYLADFVYGANDGIITTFAVVTGAVGASIAPGVIVILGIANLFADGFSMGASSFLSTISERNLHASIRQEQEYDIEYHPDIAREEVRSILKKWNVPREILEKLTSVFTRKKTIWRDFIMKHEFDVPEEGNDKPFQHGLATFTAFVIAGFLPILPYILHIGNEHQRFIISIIMTCITLFGVGASQSLLTNKKWWLKSGGNMLLVGGIAACISYGVGFLVKTVFGIAL